MKQSLNTICIVLGIVLSNTQSINGGQICIHFNMDIESTDVVVALYQNYNGIFIDTDYAFNGCMNYTVFNSER